MPLINVPVGILPSQVEVPASAKRSVAGSIHIRPSGTLHLTEDEWNHIKKARPDLATRMHVVGESMHAPTLASDEPAPAPPPAEPVVETAVAESAPEAAPAPAGRRSRG